VPEGESRSRRKPGATKRARGFRKAGNQAEALLWIELKARRLNGFKFVRQFPVGPYFADFLCREAKLVVELDGSQHAGSAHDEKRDAFLTAQGYSVLRFWSVDMLRDREAVLATIVEALEGWLTASVNAPDMKFKSIFHPGRGGG
jgi:very-short-patch-repair endonuclease